MAMVYQFDTIRDPPAMDPFSGDDKGHPLCHWGSARLWHSELERHFPRRETFHSVAIGVYGSGF